MHGGQILGKQDHLQCTHHLKMVSIKIWLRIVNLVGEVMLGKRLVEYMMSRKSETFLYESHFRRSILKSPSNLTSLFSLIIPSAKGYRYS